MKQTTKKTKSFLNPSELLSQVGLEEGMSVADFGCGNGYYSVAAAKVVGSKGQVYALDILENMLSQTSSQARLENAYNVSTIHCDLEKGSCQELKDQSIDLVVLSSLLHQIEKKEVVLREVYRVLKTSGQVLVIEWQLDSKLGPPRAERVSENETKEDLEKIGLKPVKDLSAGSFHYAFLYSK